MNFSNQSMPQEAKRWVFRLLAPLLIVILTEAVFIGILWARWQQARQAAAPRDFGLPKGNFIQRAHPKVDFSQVYPGRSAAEIDRIQREAFELPYFFQPFTGFQLAPAKKQTVEVSTAGFRQGSFRSRGRRRMAR